jgi:hypothetical protein
LRHALNKLPDKLVGVPASVRRGLRSKFHTLLHRCRQRKSLRVVALGQCLRHFANRIDTAVGEAHGERIRHWFETKKAGWYAVLEDPKMPAMSTMLDQAHNAMDRKLFAMKGFHHPGGSQAAFLTGLAHLYNPIPYQRRALNAGKCGVEVEGGVLPRMRGAPQSRLSRLISRMSWRVSDAMGGRPGRLRPRFHFKGCRSPCLLQRRTVSAFMRSTACGQLDPMLDKMTHKPRSAGEH